MKRSEEMLVDQAIDASAVKPTVTVLQGEISTATDAAEAILLKHAERIGIFQRGADLVRIIKLPEARIAGGLHRVDGTVMLEIMKYPAMFGVFDRLINFQRYTAKQEKRTVDCPQAVVTEYLSRRGKWRVPVLTGFITAPIMRPDGTILRTPGFDEATGLYLVSDVTWPLIPQAPSLAQAQQALDDLLEPFDQFPFVKEADLTQACRSVFATAILTGIQRRILGPCPLFGFLGPHSTHRQKYACRGRRHAGDRKACPCNSRVPSNGRISKVHNVRTPGRTPHHQLGQHREDVNFALSGSRDHSV